MEIGFVIGLVCYLLVRVIATGFYTVDQSECAIVTSFGRAERLGEQTSADLPVSASLNSEEKSRYDYPVVRVIPPGGPYFKLPWQRVYKVSTAMQTVSIAFDPDDPNANSRGAALEAVTKDQLNTGLKGQMRFSVSRQNLYAFVFGIRNPTAHIMGYFVSILRERVANFVAPHRSQDLADPASSLDPLIAASALGGSAAGTVQGISINDLRKNLTDLNSKMESECQSSVARYGIQLDAALVTEINPPNEVESALAAINTAHNSVSSEISLAQAAADQKIVQSRRAVEIETLKAQAEVQMLLQIADQLKTLRAKSPGALSAYVRNVRLSLYSKARSIFVEVAKS